MAEEEKKVRTFDTGATRDVDQDKLDFEGFFSPLVLFKRAKYMHKNRFQSDGKMRDSDNWQKGMPMDAYMKSAWRHFMEVWYSYRQGNLGDEFNEACCALMFNIEGMLHENLKELADEDKDCCDVPDCICNQPKKLSGIVSYEELTKKENEDD